MGFFRNWNKREPVSEFMEKALLDDQPKTDTLQPNQPAGDTSMAVTLNLTPYAAGSGAITTINDPAHGHGIVAYPSHYPANITYTIVNPQYYQAGTGTLVNQPCPSAAMTNNHWYDLNVGGFVKPAIDRAEFSEEEISQAEQLMVELSA